MRVFTLLILICPAQILFAQKTDLLASGNTYTSFAEAMFGKESSNTRMAASGTTENIADPVKTVTVEKTTAVEVKDTISTTELVENLVKEVPAERKIVRKGVGVWVNSSSKENLNYCYALHRTAPIGSVIDLKNPMNGRVVSVKIIGKLPSTEQYKGVTILVSAAAARQLHILDRKFIVNLMIPESLVYGSK